MSSGYDKHKSQVEAARQGDGKFGSYSASHSGVSLHAHESAHPGEDHGNYWSRRRQEAEQEQLQRWAEHRQYPMGSFSAHASHEMRLIRRKKQDMREIDEAEATEHIISEDKLEALRETEDGQAALDVCVKAYTGEDFDPDEARAAAKALDKDRRALARDARKRARSHRGQQFTAMLSGDQDQQASSRSAATKLRQRADDFSAPDSAHRVIADKLRGYAGQPGYEHHGPPPFTYREST